MDQILIGIDSGEQRESSSQKDSPKSPFPRERLAVCRRDGAEKTDEEQTESAEHRAAEYHDAFMQLPEPFRFVGPLAQYSALDELKLRQYVVQSPGLQSLRFFFLLFACFIFVFNNILLHNHTHPPRQHPTL